MANIMIIENEKTVFSCTVDDEYFQQVNEKLAQIFKGKIKTHNEPIAKPEIQKPKKKIFSRDYNDADIDQL